MQLLNAYRPIEIKPEMQEPYLLFLGFLAITFFIGVCIKLYRINSWRFKK